MPDRELTPVELQKFIRESAEGEMGLNALKIHQNEKGKPSLFDLCILELYARVEGQIRIIIQQGRAIEILKAKVKALELK